MFQTNFLAKFLSVSNTCEHHPVTPQYTLATDAFQLGYTEDGHCKGEVDRSLPPPQRLGWEIPAEVSAPGLSIQVCIH